MKQVHEGVPADLLKHEPCACRSGRDLARRDDAAEGTSQRGSGPPGVAEGA